MSIFKNKTFYIGLVVGIAALYAYNYWVINREGVEGAAAENGAA